LITREVGDRESERSVEDVAAMGCAGAVRSRAGTAERSEGTLDGADLVQIVGHGFEAETLAR
jgi:hypothetical protein